MGEEISVDIIMERMRTPWALTPKQIKDSYLYLSSIYSSLSLECIDAEAEAASYEAKLISEDMTSAKAKTLLKASEEGRKAAKARGKLKAVDEMIKALKRAQNYFVDDARNQY